MYPMGWDRTVNEEEKNFIIRRGSQQMMVEISDYQTFINSESGTFPQKAGEYIQFHMTSTSELGDMGPQITNTEQVSGEGYKGYRYEIQLTNPAPGVTPQIAWYVLTNATSVLTVRGIASAETSDAFVDGVYFSIETDE